jgi:hypothetical protein
MRPINNQRLITYNDKTLNITQWAEELGIHRNTIWRRMKYTNNLDIIFKKYNNKGTFEKRSYSELKNIVGHKFGTMTVLGFSHVKNWSYWICKCECGSITTKDSQTLNYYRRSKKIHCCSNRCPLHQGHVNKPYKVNYFFNKNPKQLRYIVMRRIEGKKKVLFSSKNEQEVIDWLEKHPEYKI